MNNENTEVRNNPAAVNIGVGDTFSIGISLDPRFSDWYVCVKEFELVSKAKELGFDLCQDPMPREELIRFNVGLINALLREDFIEPVRDPNQSLN